MSCGRGYPVRVRCLGSLCVLKKTMRELKLEYREGPEATERFEEGMRSLFQVPKFHSKKKKQKDKPTASAKKSKSSDRD